MPRIHLLMIAAYLVYPLAGCGDDAGNHAHDAGPQLDASMIQHDAANGCNGTVCGACYQPLTLEVTDAKEQPIDAWSAQITGKGVDCTATSSLDSCISMLKVGTYKVALTVGKNVVDTRSVTILPSNAGPTACCDCGYVPLTVQIHQPTECLYAHDDAGAHDPRTEDAGAEDAGTGVNPWCP